MRSLLLLNGYKQTTLLLNMENTRRSRCVNNMCKQMKGVCLWLPLQRIFLYYFVHDESYGLLMLYLTKRKRSFWGYDMDMPLLIALVLNFYLRWYHYYPFSVFVVFGTDWHFVNVKLVKTRLWRILKIIKDPTYSRYDICQPLLLYAWFSILTELLKNSHKQLSYFFAPSFSSSRRTDASKIFVLFYLLYIRLL